MLLCKSVVSEVVHVILNFAVCPTSLLVFVNSWSTLVRLMLSALNLVMLMICWHFARMWLIQDSHCTVINCVQYSNGLYPNQSPLHNRLLVNVRRTV